MGFGLPESTTGVWRLEPLAAFESSDQPTGQAKQTGDTTMNMEPIGTIRHNYIHNIRVTLYRCDDGFVWVRDGDLIEKTDVVADEMLATIREGKPWAWSGDSWDFQPCDDSSRLAALAASVVGY